MPFNWSSMVGWPKSTWHNWLISIVSFVRRKLAILLQNAMFWIVILARPKSKTCKWRKAICSHFSSNGSVYNSQLCLHSVSDVQSRVISLCGLSDSRPNTVCYSYCSILLCCVSHVIDELKLYCTYVQEVSHVATLTYFTISIAFVFLA